MLHRIGVRYMTLTHNGGPGWAEAAAALDGSFIEEGSKDGGEEREGLTAFGCEVMAVNTGSASAPPGRECRQRASSECLGMSYAGCEQ
jgi:hypothetical protein